jgi:hypothetical protein
MESIKDDTIGGFNSYLSTLKTSGTPIDFTRQPLFRAKGEPGEAGRGSPVHRQRIDIMPMLGSITECEPSRPKLQVQTCFHNIDVCRDVEIVADEYATSRRRADQPARIVSLETVVVPLYEAGEPVREGIFTANADRPSAACGAGRCRSNSGKLKAGRAVYPSAAALHVSEKTIPNRIPNSPGHG